MTDALKAIIQKFADAEIGHATGVEDGRVITLTFTIAERDLILSRLRKR